MCKRTMRKTFVLLIILLMINSSLLVVSTSDDSAFKNKNKNPKSSDNWYNQEWRYRMPITVNENSGSDLTNYQTLIEVDTASLVSEGKMQNDGDDIRFTNQDGNELSYWIEHFDELKYNEPNDYVASWSMDEGAGSTIYDNSTNNNDGTIYGVSWTGGKFDSALSFDGDGDYVDCGDISATNSMTIEAWINPTDLENVGIVTEYMAGSPGYDRSYYFGIENKKLAAAIFRTGTANPGAYTQFYSTQDVPINTFTYAAMTLDSEKDVLSIYINGKLDNYTNTTDTPHQTPIPVYIGAAQGYPNAQGYFFNGTIDEVRIYNRTLSADEIKSIYEEKSKLWVKVPSISANGETTIYMYYGNPSASSASDGDATFDFFDDFEDNIYADKWKLLSEAHGWDNDAADVSESNGNIWIRGDWSDKQFIFGRQMSFTGGSKYKIMLWLKAVSTGNGKGLGICPTKTDWSDTWSDACKYWTDENDHWVWLANIPINIFQKYTVEYLTNTGTFRVYEEDATLKHERTVSTWNLSSAYTYTIGLATGNEYNEVLCDLYAVRKYTSPEPTATMGAEEQLWQDAWHDGNGYEFTYRRLITISNTGSANNLSYYQTQVILNPSNFDYSKTQANGNDIRFVAADSTNYWSIPFWVENWDTSGESKIWVKVPNIPANGETTIYMYYGNPTVSATSNGDATFGFFDDFNDAIYTDKWEIVANNGSVSESVGVITLTADYNHVSTELNTLTSLSVPAPLILETRAQRTSGYDLYNALYSTTTNDYVYYRIAMWGAYFYIDKVGDNFGNQTSPQEPATSEWREYREILAGTTWKVWHGPSLDNWDTGTPDELTLDATADNYEYRIGIKAYTSSVCKWDWIRVRKYTSPEPTSIVGSEEEFSADFWYDTFVDTSKIDYKENISVENGDAKLAPGEFTADEHTVALWHFNENSGTTTYDETPNNNDGTINGATWTTGKFGSALSFDGLNDYVDVGTMGDFGSSLGRAQTYEVWFKTTTSTATSQMVFFGTYNSGKTTRIIGELWENRIAFGIRDDQGDSHHYDFYTDPINYYDGKWHYIAIVAFPNNRTGRIFFDGNEQNLTYTLYTYPPSEFSNFEYSLPIGAVNVRGYVDHYFSGSIDEFRISNIARTKFDYYSTFGSIVSEKICLPANETWKTLYINKTEPENTHIKVSVLDGENNQTINGYENMEQNTISLSSIDTYEHPTIRLKAELTGNGTATPLLHYWSVNWTNATADIDLAINSTDISVSETVNGNITIKAVVHNLGNQTSENIPVRFLVNELQIANDVVIDTIPNKSSKNISINWPLPPPGGYIITVIADPNNLIPELNETNNNASKIIDIPSRYDVELSLLSNAMQGIGSGESAVYTIAVLNLGNANDTVYINASVAPPSWGVLLTKQTVMLSAGFYPGNSTDFSLIITAPDDAGVNEMANVMVTATSQGNPDEKDEVTTITIAKPTYCIVVTCLNNNTHYTDPNVVTEYELGILNYGRENENDTIELELSGVSSHWTAELSAESVILGYRNFTTVMLSVTPPSNASALSSCAVTVEARSMFDVNLCNSTTLTTCVNQLYSLEYNYSEWVRVDPGSEFNITVYVKNSGNGQDVLSFIVMNSPSGWVVTAPGQLILNQSENRNITISIYVPKFTLNGNYSVVVNCTNLAKTYMLGLNLTINKIFELEITTPFETKYICPNKTAAILFKITNTGNCFDMVNLSYDAPDTWNPKFCYNGSETTNITLNMNETKELVLNITPVELGIYDIVVKCQSENNLSVNASKTITVYVELPKLQITNMSYPSNIREGDIVPVVAVIRNTGNVSAEGVIVWLFVDDEKIPYNNTFAIITSGSSVYATLYWTAKAGTYIFKVSIVLEEGVEEVFVSEQVIVKPKEHAAGFNLLYLLLIIPIVLTIVSGFVMYKKRKTAHINAKSQTTAPAVFRPVEEKMGAGVIHVKPLEEDKLPAALKLVDGYQCPLCNKKFALGMRERPVKIKCLWCSKNIEVNE